jgi:Coenzyme PQQ synthesis protein D (PqqD)
MATSRMLVESKQLFRRNESVETAPLNQETLLYHAKINRFCILNRTSSFIWNRLQTPVSPEEIASELCATFDGIALTEALKDVTQAVANLLELDLAVAYENA